MRGGRPAVTVALVAVAAACPAPYPDVDAWTELAPLGGGPRQESAVVNLRDEVVVVGGVDAASNTLATVEAYDVAGDAWRRLADLPVTAHHAHVASCGDRLFVLGFLQGLSFTPDPRGFVYDPDDDAWSPVAALPAPHDRGGGIALCASDGVYVIGGLAGNPVATVHRYDPDADSYAQLADLPAVTDHLVGGVIDDEIFVAGGRNRSIRAHRADVWRYDRAGDAWVAGADMPTSRAGAAAAVSGGELFVFGGEGDANASSGVFAEVEAYDPVSDTWRELDDMPRPRHGMGAAAVGNAIYIPGGADVQGFAAISLHDKFTP